MKFLISVLLALCAAPASARGAAPDPLVGAWIVERFTNTPEGAAPIFPFGKQPVGLFVFSADGHFSFNVMRGPRPDETEPGDADAEWTPAWYVSYFGTYSYDPVGSSWTSRVLGGNMLSYIGTEQTRVFTLVGDVLTISASYEEGGRKIRAERVLRRIRR